LVGTIKFSTTRKTPASGSVFKSKFQLRGNNPVCAGPFHLLRGRAAEREHCGHIIIFYICN